MGRKPSKPGSIPRFRARKRGAVTYYFYDHGGKPRQEESLGRDYGLAIKRWAAIEHESNVPPQAVVTFKREQKRNCPQMTSEDFVRLGGTIERIPAAWDVPDA